MTPEFADALTAFLLNAQLGCDRQHGERKGYTTISYEDGRRYTRIIATEGDQRSAWAFVDKTNGDILKADSWKAPAKNFPRGNIFRDYKEFSWTGVK